MSRPDIRRPEAVDARWLTDVLQHGGVDAVVKSFTAKGVGTGQIGDSVRFKLEYARRGDDAPASLVGKFPAAGDDLLVVDGPERASVDPVDHQADGVGSDVDDGRLTAVRAAGAIPARPHFRSRAACPSLSARDRKGWDWS